MREEAARGPAAPAPRLRRALALLEQTAPGEPRGDLGRRAAAQAQDAGRLRARDPRLLVDETQEIERGTPAARPLLPVRYPCLLIYSYGEENDLEGDAMSAVLGLAAGLLTTACWVPQLVRAYRTRSTSDISWVYVARSRQRHRALARLRHGRAGHRAHRHQRRDCLRTRHAGAPQVALRPQSPAGRARRLSPGTIPPSRVVTPPFGCRSAGAPR